MTLDIGVVGTGMMGQDHVQRLATSVPDAKVVAVSDVNVEQAKRVGERVEARVFSDGHDLIADDGVQAVLIASPGPTHEELTLACIAAGKPVLCEKPLAPTTDACLRVLEAEAALPRRLVQVGFMRRYDDGFRALKARLDDGQVGRALLLHCRHRNASVPPGFTSDMMITDSVVHDIDVTRWLLGQEIVAASVFKARPSSLAPAGLQDPQMVLLETDQGVLVDVESFVNCQFGYDIRYELVGETGTISLGEDPGPRIRQQGRHQCPQLVRDKVVNERRHATRSCQTYSTGAKRRLRSRRPRTYRRAAPPFIVPVSMRWAAVRIEDENLRNREGRPCRSCRP